MSENRDSGARERLTKQGEDALGKLAQDLIDNPLVNSAITRVFDAREKAVQAQEAAMGALNIPSAADLERLTRRVRSVSQRLEGIEDGVDRLDERLAKLHGSSDIEQRLGQIEAQLDKIVKELTAIHKALPGAAKPVARGQERLKVSSDG
jgi:predicted  nucleic acid-binding Zn-ribbon protein